MATSHAPTEHYPFAMTIVGVAAGTFALCRCEQQTITGEIGRLNEEEILMQAVTGVLFKGPLIRQIHRRGYDTGMEAMSDKPAPPSP
jgi:hypothetical protein